MARRAVIVNGRAGGGRCGARAQTYLEALTGRGDTEVWHTEAPGHGTELARRASERGFADVIAVGGDGTVFEVVNGLLPAANGTPRLGILPLGTGNSFVRDLDLLDADAALQTVLRGQARRCDAVRAEHDGGTLFFVNLLSVGFAARVGALTNRRFKPLGRAGYVLAVLTSLARLQRWETPLQLDDRAVDRRPYNLLTFSNSRYTGGDMMMAPDADISDGRVDVVRIGPMGRRRFLGAFPRIFKGTHPELPEIDITTAARVEFRSSEPLEVMVDGEVIPLTLRSLEVVPGALEVLA